MKKIKIYTTPTCVYCKMAKEYFRSEGLAYEEFDVTTDIVKRDEMIRLSGSMGVPVILIDDQLILGFDKKAIEQALRE